MVDNNKQASTIFEAIEYIRTVTTSEGDKGTRFERLTRFFLKNYPLWKQILGGLDVVKCADQRRC